MKKSIKISLGLFLITKSIFFSFCFTAVESQENEGIVTGRLLRGAVSSSLGGGGGRDISNKSSSSSSSSLGNQMMKSHQQSSPNYFSWDEYYCTLQGLMNKDECLNTQTVGPNKEYCQFCTLLEDEGEEMGICVSPQQASKALETLTGKISCDSSKENHSSSTSPIDHNDITTCNLDGVDKEYCLDPTKVKGSKCIWCDVGALGGFCFPQSWENTASHFLNCTAVSTTTTTTTDVPDFGSLDSNHPNSLILRFKDDSSSTDAAAAATSSSSWDFFTSSCYKNSTDHDTCITMKDDESDESCLWCDAYVFGFCLNTQEAEKVSSFLTCSSTTLTTPQTQEEEEKEEEQEYYKDDDEEEEMIHKTNTVTTWNTIMGSQDEGNLDLWIAVQ